MSLAGGAEQISLLRTAIARIEAGAQAGQATSGIAVSLDQRRSAFFELAPAAPVDRGAATGFAMALAARWAAASSGDGLRWRGGREALAATAASRSVTIRSQI